MVVVDVGMVAVNIGDVEVVVDDVDKVDGDEDVWFVGLLRGDKESESPLNGESCGNKSTKGSISLCCAWCSSRAIGVQSSVLCAWRGVSTICWR